MNMRSAWEWIGAEEVMWALRGSHPVLMHLFQVFQGLAEIPGLRRTTRPVTTVDGLAISPTSATGPEEEPVEEEVPTILPREVFTTRVVATTQGTAIKGTTATTTAAATTATTTAIVVAVEVTRTQAVGDSEADIEEAVVGVHRLCVHLLLW